MLFLPSQKGSGEANTLQKCTFGDEKKTMSGDTSILSVLRFRRIAFAVMVGLSVAAWLVYRNFDARAFYQINWTYHSTLFLLLSLLMMVIRDLAYIYRIRLLSDNKLSWKQSFQVIMLWEFSSAVTPSVVGGSAVAMYFITREGISAGRSTAIVLITAFLDELFFVLMVPVVFFLTGSSLLFKSDGKYLLFNTQWGTAGIFWIGYGFILLLILLIYLGIFVRPRAFKWILIKFFSLGFLRKWRQKSADVGTDIITTSRELRGRPFPFWLKAFGATFVSWTARFWVVNMLIMTVAVVNPDQFLIYARQLIMWVIMLISPTPGGSGIAEFIFTGFLGEFIPTGLAPSLGLLWRLISYYPYLFFGAIILPIWIKRVYAKHHHPSLSHSQSSEAPAPK